MESKLRQLEKSLKELNLRLQKEYKKLEERYGFSIHKRGIKFLDNFRRKNKKFRIPVWKYAVPKDIRHILSLPFIYSMIIPSVILDLFITIYNHIALPLYHIPPVKRRDYIVYDRKFLDYLNLIQKVHCLYCSYVNGLFAYSVEIAARTERYWCPIKAASKPKTSHDWYDDFAEYGNPEEWVEKFNDKSAFNDIREKKQ